MAAQSLVPAIAPRGDQMVQCQTDTIFTSANGEIATKSRLRTTVAGASEAEIILLDRMGTHAPASV